MSHCIPTEHLNSWQRVRVAALKYLALLPDVIRYDVLHPHKVHVLKELGKVLDDPKRVVRREAVATRSVHHFSGACLRYSCRDLQNEMVRA